jgi:hypothetical protein
MEIFAARPITNTNVRCVNTHTNTTKVVDGHPHYASPTPNFAAVAVKHKFYLILNFCYFLVKDFMKSQYLEFLFFAEF